MQFAVIRFAFGERLLRVTSIRSHLLATRVCWLAVPIAGVFGACGSDSGPAGLEASNGSASVSGTPAPNDAATVPAEPSMDVSAAVSPGTAGGPPAVQATDAANGGAGASTGGSAEPTAVSPESTLGASGGTGGVLGTGGSAGGAPGGNTNAGGATEPARGGAPSGAGQGGQGAEAGAGGLGGEGGTSAGGAGGSGLAEECGLPEIVSFQDDVQPFLTTACGGGNGCHVIDADSTTAAGGYNHAYDWITAGSHDSSCPDAPFRFEIVVDVIRSANPPSCSNSREMPPQNEAGANLRTPLTPCEIAALEAWLAEPYVTQTHRPDDTSPTTPYPMPPFN